MAKNLNGKHAYLLMVHHRKDLIDLLLEVLDDSRNDIFMHIDARSAFNIQDFQMHKANLYPVKRTKVSWGGYSQVQCELALMEEAKKHGNYNYYHLMHGSAYPLKSQDYLHDFYDQNIGVEYIELDDAHDIDRVKYLFPFNEVKAQRNLVEKILFNLSRKVHLFQKVHDLDHFKQFNMVYKKGFALWSITDEFVEYLLSQKDVIRKMLKYSTCGDEIMPQTFAYNSKFRDRICEFDGEHSTAMWASTWPIEEKLGKVRQNNNFIYEDLDYLLNSGANFARKFENEDGIQLINEIKKTF